MHLRCASGFANQPVNDIFAGVNADLAVSDSDAWLC
jgi:hypothetical protein